jgi:serine phosphatase RsbU (regulator of sigma subunit)/anti-sigma regulatory factor (Ser/Thr protein kinase)
MATRSAGSATAPARPSGAAQRSQQAKVAATGLAGVLLTLAVVHAGLTGLHRIERGNDAVARLDSARGYFQDADMMHDALYSSVLGALLVEQADVPGAPRDPVVDVRQDAARFRADLRAIDALDLPPGIREALGRVRPAQDAYIAAAERIVAPSPDPAVRRRDLPAFSRAFGALRDEQDVVTRQLRAEAERARALAQRDQRSAERRIVVAGSGALLGLFALSYWLSRVVRKLALQARRERGVAETLQRILLPDSLPDLPGVRMAAHYLPSADGALVGGDWYDVLVLPGGEIGLVMGDVAGHDLRAAAEMGQLRNALRAYAAEGAPADAVVERLNELCFQQRLETIATCVYAVLDPIGRSLTVVNAGHYPPLLLEPPQGAKYLDGAPHPPVGAVRSHRYEAVTYPLPADCVVLLYTDGLLERRRASVEEGLDRLTSAVVDAPADLDGLCAHLLGRLFEHEHPQDDVALLAVAPAARLGEHLTLNCLAAPSSLLPVRRTLQRWLDEAGATDVECYEVTVACSEAVTNAVEHAYGPGTAYFQLDAVRAGRTVRVRVRDWGSWRPPRGEDRGRGLFLMHRLMDEVSVEHGSSGTVVEMSRDLASLPAERPLAAR